MKVKIGVVVTTQGPAALLGSSFLKAIRLAYEDLKDTAHRYDLVVEEIAGPDKAEPAIRKLIQTDKVNALVVGFSISGQIVKPYAEAAKIPLFCICSVGSVGDQIFTFTIMPLAEDEASQWIAEARRRGIKRIARLTQDYPSIDNHVRALKEEGAKVGIEFVYDPGIRLATHMMPYAYDSLKILVQGFERGDVLNHIRGMTEYDGTAGKITKKAGTGNFRSAPAVWVIRNGRPVLGDSVVEPMEAK